MLATVDGVAPDELEIGMEVEVGFRTIDEDLTLPVWRRPGSSAPATASEPVAQASVGQEAPASEAKTQRLLVGVPTPGQALPDWKLPTPPTMYLPTHIDPPHFQARPEELRGGTALVVSGYI